MSRRDVETVQRMFEAFAARDVEAVLSLLDPAVEFSAQATSEVVGRDGPYRGHAGIRQYFEDVERVWDELRVEPVDVRSVAGAVVIFGRVYGVRAGEVLDTGALWTWRLRDGRVVSGSVFSTPEADPRPRGGAGETAQAPRPPDAGRGQSR